VSVVEEPVSQTTLDMFFEPLLLLLLLLLSRALLTVSYSIRP